MTVKIKIRHIRKDKYVINENSGGIRHSCDWFRGCPTYLYNLQIPCRYCALYKREYPMTYWQMRRVLLWHRVKGWFTWERR